jgi:hypothetical protein
MFVIKNDFDTNILEISDSYSAIQSYQSYCNLSTWNCVQSIVITTTMPIVPTIQAKPQQFGTNSNFVNTSSNINVKIISDFEITNNENGKQFLPSVCYSPYLYRLVPMLGNNPLTSLDLEVYWRDTYNNLWPLSIPSGGHCDFKILFRKKYLGV